MKYEVRLLLAGPVLALCAACSGSGEGAEGTAAENKAYEATGDDYDDVAQALSTVVATGNGGGEMGSFNDATDLFLGIARPDVASIAAGQFGCAHGDVAYGYEVTCQNQQAVTLPNCGESTANATVDVHWSGTLNLPDLDGVVNRSGQWKVEHVRSGTAEFSGAGALVFDAQFQSAFRDAALDYRLTTKADYPGVRVQLNPRKLAGGMVRYSMDVARMAEDGITTDAKFHVDAAVTFQADKAKFVLDDEHAYDVDMTSGVVERTPERTQPSGAIR